MKKILVVSLVLSVTLGLLYPANLEVFAVSKWFSPDHGKVYAHTDIYLLDWLDWDADAEKFGVSDAVEMELRGRVAPISNYYVGLAPSWYSNLPGSYREYDFDDASIGCASPHLINHTQFYWGYTLLTPKTPQPSSFSAFLECELGYDYGFLPDPIPIDYEVLVPDLLLPMQVSRNW